MSARIISIGGTNTDKRGQLAPRICTWSIDRVCGGLPHQLLDADLDGFDAS
jgi:hypothetical protein